MLEQTLWLEWIAYQSRRIGGHEGSQSHEYHEYSLLIDSMKKVIDANEIDY